MQCQLDKMFDDLQSSLFREFSNYLYCVKVSEGRKSFYVLIRKKEEKIFGDSRKDLLQNVKNITENILDNYARICDKIIISYIVN